MNFELVIDNYGTLWFTVHTFICRILHSGTNTRRPFGTDALAYWDGRESHTVSRSPKLRLRLCDPGIIHAQIQDRTDMFTAKQQRPIQEFPWPTFPRFYRPWRLAATSHHDVVPPPDIALSHPPVVPPSHVAARI
jgi:hypothetical protein